MSYGDEVHHACRNLKSLKDGLSVYLCVRMKIKIQRGKVLLA